MGDSMTKHYETLSAFLDDETTELESQRLLRDMDSETLDTLSRWSYARDIMKKQESVPVSTGFSADLMARIAEAPAPQSAGFVTGISRIAVAASVAAATFVGWYSWDSQQTTQHGASIAANDTPMTRPLAEVSLASQQMGASEVEAPAFTTSSRLDDLLLRHNALMLKQDGQSVVPFARLVSMDAFKAPAESSPVEPATSEAAE